MYFLELPYKVILLVEILGLFFIKAFSQGHLVLPYCFQKVKCALSFTGLTIGTHKRQVWPPIHAHLCVLKQIGITILGHSVALNSCLGAGEPGAMGTQERWAEKEVSGPQLLRRAGPSFKGSVLRLDSWVPAISTCSGALRVACNSLWCCPEEPGTSVTISQPERSRPWTQHLCSIFLSSM